MLCTRPSDQGPICRWPGWAEESDMPRSPAHGRAGVLHAEPGALGRSRQVRRTRPVLVFLAKRAGAGLAVWILSLAMIMTVAMALTPAIAVWRQARQLGVPLSLGSYLANAGCPNLGPPQRERSVVYGTAPDGTKLELDVWRTGHRRPYAGSMRSVTSRPRWAGWSRTRPTTTWTPRASA